MFSTNIESVTFTGGPVTTQIDSIAIGFGPDGTSDRFELRLDSGGNLVVSELNTNTVLYSGPKEITLILTPKFYRF